YVACAIGALGMVVHFGMHLIAFLRRRIAAPKAGPLNVPEQKRKGRASDARSGTAALPLGRSWATAAFVVPAIFLAFCLVYLVSHAAVGPYEGKDGIDIDRLARVPVSFDGRPMPLDAVARGNLKIISGRESISTDEGRVPAIQWLADVLADNDRAKTYKVFRVDNLQLKGLLDLDPQDTRFYCNDLDVHQR